MEDKKVMKLDDGACSVCKADFFKKDLDEQGRCHVCSKAGLQPGGKPKQDYIQQSIPKMDREEVKKLIREVLAEIKEEDNLVKPAAFAPKICAKCGQEFIPNSPAQKICNACKTEENK